MIWTADGELTKDQLQWRVGEIEENDHQERARRTDGRNCHNPANSDENAISDMAYGRQKETERNHDGSDGPRRADKLTTMMDLTRKPCYMQLISYLMTPASRVRVD